MSHYKKLNILVLLGPTASGKTNLAIELAQQQNGAVISADSRQVYAGFNIGTAKPKDAWQDTPHEVTKADAVDSVPHYLLNIASPTENYTLSQWQSAADTLLKTLIEQNITPLVVGGTMLYIDSLLYRFSIPEVAPNNALRQGLEQKTTGELYRDLLNQDPAALDFIEPHNRRRIIRALEVIKVTGRRFSELRKQESSPYEFTVIGLFPGWDQLKQNITARAQKMLDDGLLAETEKLIQTYGADLPLLNTMNYKQAKAILSGTHTRDAALDEMIRVTLRYAHRQMSWWKRNKEIKWVESPYKQEKSL